MTRFHVHEKTSGFLFDTLILWLLFGHYGFSGWQLTTVVESGPESVVNAGDLLFVSRSITNVMLGDIAVVNDKEKGSLYVQKVTGVYTPIGHSMDKTMVQIKYQREHNNPLRHRWFEQKDVVGKVMFILPYGGMINYLVHKYSANILQMVAVFWICKLWTGDGKTRIPFSLCGFAIFVLVFLSQPTFVT